jgi:hypothetical protein
VSSDPQAAEDDFWTKKDGPFDGEDLPPEFRKQSVFVVAALLGMKSPSGSLLADKERANLDVQLAILSAQVAVLQARSADKHAASLSRATFWLVAATGMLFLATLALVIITAVKHGG